MAVPESEPVGEDRRAKFVLTKSSDYRTIAANGVWGGVTPRGDLRVDFFLESLTFPEAVTHLVNPDGKLGNELSRAPSDRAFTREIQMGVLLSLDHADSIGRWLIDTVSNFRKKQQDREK